MNADQDAARQRFERALRAAGAVRSPPGLFQELLVRHAEAHRHYHTLEHVQACLRGLDRFRELAERPDEVELALWFHDAVYDPAARCLGRRSAELARHSLADLGIPADAVERIAAYVEATQRHEASSNDGALVIDLDLGILGVRPAAFDCFELQIRSEYPHVPDALYVRGRLEVLERFLSRPQIYQHSPIRSALEAPARSNLRRRIQELRTGAG